MHTSKVGWIVVGLAVAAALTQVLIARILLKRRLRAEFPIFFTYSCFGAVMVAVGLVGYFLSSCWIGGTGRVEYFYLYWTLSFLYMALEFGVMYEILVNALKPYSALIDLGKMLFRWATVFLLFAAVLTALATNGNQASRLTASINLLEHSMRLMQCGLLLLFFFLEKRLGFSWRNYNMSIALGMGITAVMDLSVSYLKGHYPDLSNGLAMTNSLVYLGVLGFWSVCLSVPEPARQKNVLDSPSRLIFQRWNEALISYTTRAELATVGGMDSFLPGVEQTVDRVLARKVIQ